MVPCRCRACRRQTPSGRGRLWGRWRCTCWGPGWPWCASKAKVGGMESDRSSYLLVHTHKLTGTRVGVETSALRVTVHTEAPRQTSLTGTWSFQWHARWSMLDRCVRKPTTHVRIHKHIYADICMYTLTLSTIMCRCSIYDSALLQIIATFRNHYN